MATAPPVITALPTPPDPNDRATFKPRAYPWSVAQQTLATEVGAVAANVFSNATEATEAAALAVPAAAAAEAASNATLWVSGTTYAAGVVVWSPINALSYRRKTAGAGTTDPSADSANWAALAGGVPSLNRSARTSNTILGTADKGKLIDITSGTFTQTFAAAATLGDGWFCYLRNSGTGDVTLDPSGSETIDGLASFVMYPGECRLLQCDGAALRSIVLNAFYKVFTASGFFIKPPGYSWFGGLLWAGGASGAKNGNTSAQASGGGGGSCLPFNVAAPIFGATETVTIGSGGSPVTVAGTNSATNLGGDSSVGTVLITYAGKANQSGGSSISGATATLAQSAYVLGAAGGQADSRSYYGGGGGGNTGAGASSVYGGGGGAGVNSDLVSKAGGASVYGGSGGTSNSSSSGQDGFAPGGGGGGTQTGAQSGAGARGELRVWGGI